MLRHALLFGLLGGLLVVLLKWLEYRWLLMAHSVEIYAALVAALFAALGLWLGQRLTRARRSGAATPTSTSTPEPGDGLRNDPPPPGKFERDTAALARLGLTPRELEILEQIATGLSNKEIAARLFVSENTVKTHASRVFDKLGARRRTQAVQRARELRLIP